jgi:hypothetical protein
MTVESGSTYSGSTWNHTFKGNLVNDGSFTVAGATTGSTFSGSTNQTVSGSGSTTTFGLISIANTGVSPNNVVEISSTTFTSAAACLGNSLLTSGVIKFSGTYTWSNALFSAAGHSINPDEGIWINNPNVTITGLGGSPTNNGLLRISNGTYNVGTSSGNSMSGAATYVIEGGTLNVAGRLVVSTTGSYTQSGGTVNVSTVGNSSSSTGSFDVSGSSGNTFNMSGGTINLVQASTAATPWDFRVNPSTANLSVTGGTLNIGTSATATNFTFRIQGVTPSIVVTNTTNNKTANLIAATTVRGNVTINTGATLALNGNNLTVTGNSTDPGNWSNSGTFTSGGANTVTFDNASATQTLNNGASSFFNLTHSGAGTLQLATNNLSVTGALTNSAGTLNANNLNISVGGNWTNSSTFTAGNGTVTFNGSALQTLISGGSAFNNISVTNSSGGVSLSTNDLTTNGTFTLNGAGGFNANSRSHTVTGAATITSGTYTSGSGTNTFNSGLTSSDTFTGSTGEVTTTNLTISSGTFTAPSSNLNISGNFSNSGTFTHNNGTVVFNGANQSITGSNAFYSFNKSVTSGATLTLPASATQTFAAGGTLTLQGAANNLLKIVSSTPGTQAIINPSGSRVIDYVDAKDNNNANATVITATNSYDAGNLTNWAFSAANLVWTGSTNTNWNTATNWAAGYLPNATDNVTITKTGSNNLVLETSPTVNNITISASNNVSLGSNTLTVKGTWLNNGTLNAGSSTVVFAGTTGTQTVNNGANSFNNVSHTGASTLQSLVNALNIGGTFTNSAGTFDANSIGNTFTGAVTLSGGTYNAGSATQSFNGGLTVSGGTFSGSTGEVTTTNLTISSGTFTAPSTTLNISGNFSNSGTFTHNNGNVVFNGVTQSITGATTFYNLTHDGESAETLTLNSATTINGNVTNSDGTLALNDINLTIGGNYLNSVGYGLTPGTGSVIFNHASNTQTLSMAAGGDFSNIQHTGAGTLQLLSDLAMTGNMTNSAGTLSVNGWNIVIGGNWTNSETFNPGAAGPSNSTYVALNGVSPATQTIDNGSSQFNDLRVIGTATVTMVTPAQAFGDIVVNGPIASTTVFILTGTNDQHISGSVSQIAIQDMTINKTAGTITLDKPVKVSGTLTMTQGDIITDATNILEVGTSATSVGSVSWTAGTVRGPVKRWFAAATNSNQATGIFPVGATIPGKGVINRYAQVNFTSTPGSGGYIVAEYKTGLSSTGSAGLPLTYNTNQYIQNFEEEGYWDITSYNASGTPYAALNTAPYTLKLRMNNPSTLQPGLPPSGSAGNVIADISKLRIISSKGPDHSSWVLAGTQGGGQAVLASGDFLLEETGVTGFSFFNGGGNDNNPLPVELVSFTGACDNGVISLTWQTASEFNSSHFDVEKSRDGENWQLLSTIASAGTSNELISYQTADHNAIDGNNYFRLRQVDIDGTEKLYDPINVSCSEVTTGYFSSFPNPSGNAFQVIVNNKELIGTCTMNIVDATGKVIEQREIEVKDGINMFVVSQELTPGIYFLNISNGSKSTPVLRHAIK